MVVPIVARTGEGLGALRGALATALLAPRRLAPALALSEETRHDIDSLALVVDREMPTQHDTSRAWATWVLLSIDETTPDDLSGVPAPVRLAAQRIAREAAAQGRNLDLEIIGARYRRVDAIVDETVRHRPPAGPTWTARIDSVLTHRVFGALIVIAVMLALFQALFTWSEPIITLIQASIASAQNALSGAMPPGPLTDDLADGVVAGVGNVVGFVPQIGLLFLHRDHGRRRLSRTRRVRHRSRDGGVGSTAVVRADALGRLVRPAGRDGHAYAREPHRPHADQGRSAAHVVQRAAADLRAGDRDGVSPGDARVRVRQRGRGDAAGDVPAVGHGGAHGGRGAPPDGCAGRARRSSSSCRRIVVP